MQVPTHLLVSLAIYLLILLGIGFFFGRKNKTASDYLVANKSLPSWVAILTLTATMFGGGMLVGRAQQGYTSGPVFMLYCLGAVTGQVLLALFINKMEGFSHFTTVTEYLEQRYQSKFVRTACALLSMIACIGLTATQVNSLVGVLTAMGFTNVKLTAFCCMVIIIALTVYGGMIAVSMTDSFQIILVMVGVAVLMVSTLTHNGGYSGIVEALQNTSAVLPEDYLAFSKSKVMTVIFMVLPSVMYVLIGQDGYLRLFACKNLREARKVSCIAGCLMTLISLCPVILGMVARIDFPELAENGTTATALAMVSLKYLPTALVGLFLCAILSAILSTGDSLLSAASSHFVTDFWMVFVDKNADMNSKRLMNISRLFTLVAGVVALIVSFMLPDIMSSMVGCYTLYVSGAFTPIVLGVLWKGANKYGASAGLICGIALAIAGMNGFKVGSIPGEIISFIAAALVTVIVSLITAKRTALSE